MLGGQGEERGGQTIEVTLQLVGKLGGDKQLSSGDDRVFIVRSGVKMHTQKRNRANRPHREALFQIMVLR
ncbi:hypothetical protein CCP2SC5_410010 [Azospirillaceae bacterium]